MSEGIPVPYDAHAVEARRQAAWRERDAFATPLLAEDQPHLYIKPSAPFTSGNVHIGHVRSYSIGDAYARFRRTSLGAHLQPVWSNMALHRPAEFNKSHVPAFMADEEVRRYVCVYPFVRSYEWYLLPDEERRDMLAEHGKMARGYPDVRANTVSSFALGDYEWVLAFEADELHRIVDLMRDLRASRARRHVREEVPFYTGQRRSFAELVAGLP